MMRTRIVVKFDIQGLHFWNTCDIKEVSYLKHTHRHKFYFRCEKEVTHNDRQIEIIKFKSDIISWLKATYYCPQCCEHLNFQSLSCEDIAMTTLRKFNLDLCEVLEDNENGAIVIDDNS